MPSTLEKLQYPLQNYNTTRFHTEMATARSLAGRQVLLRLCGYISMCPTLQVSHSDVVGVGLGGVAKRVVPSHSRLNRRRISRQRLYKLHVTIMSSNLVSFGLKVN